MDTGSERNIQNWSQSNVSSGTIIVYPSSRTEVAIATDASDNAIGAVLPLRKLDFT